MNSNSNLDSFGLSLFDLEIEKREKIEIEKEPKPCQPTNTQSPAQENPTQTFFPGLTPLPFPARGPARPAPVPPSLLGPFLPFSSARPPSHSRSACVARAHSESLTHRPRLSAPSPFPTRTPAPVSCVADRPGPLAVSSPPRSARATAAPVPPGFPARFPSGARPPKMPGPS